LSVKQKKLFLEHIAYQLRYYTVIMTTEAGSGHVTSCLSCAEIMAVLFFDVMQFDPNDYSHDNNDRFILSKGHAAPILYAVWHLLGKISKKELLTYRQAHSRLEGHPTRRFPYVDCATGSLGIGLSVGIGQALHAKLRNKTFKTFVLLGDSELSEGSIWEALLIAVHYKLDNLIAIVDMNRLGQSTETMVGYHAETYQEIFEAHGWHCFIVENGNEIAALQHAFNQNIFVAAKPTIFIVHTIKGAGIAMCANKTGFHGKAFAKEELGEVLKDLQECAGDAAKPVDYSWRANLPKSISTQKKQNAKIIDSPEQLFFEKKYATRKAFGITLATLGNLNQSIVSLDAEVKNSTYADIFEKAHPNRFFQCFVAEQNMVSMAVGFQARGEIPFVSTFGVFLTRAHDQMRMAAIGNNALRIVGSHAGVSIGQDGPSQMALEDIAMMATLRNSIILYPCDAISTARLMNIMLQYNDGISYLRTTREETEIIYNNSHAFEIGGFHVLKKSDQDVVTIIGAGITVFEALKAHELLKKENINTRVIDLYCIKPINAEKLASAIKQKNRFIVVVEDHYKQGGIGQILFEALAPYNVKINHLAVDKIPQSATPEEQRVMHHIDKTAIIKSVKSFF